MSVDKTVSYIHNALNLGQEHIFPTLICNRGLKSWMDKSSICFYKYNLHFGAIYLADLSNVIFICMINLWARQEL
jgi:hypothetical protein